MNMKNIFSDYNVTINEQQNIMDIMDKYRKLIYEGQEVFQVLYGEFPKYGGKIY